MCASWVQVICTVGPACWAVETLAEMMRAGMNMARINCAHGDHERFLMMLRAVRAAEEIVRAEDAHVLVPVMLDVKGPEIRTGYLEEGKSIELIQGQARGARARDGGGGCVCVCACM